MRLHKDVSIELYGLHSWDTLVPWDPLARDFPERVAPLLDREFLWLWAEPNGEGDLTPVVQSMLSTGATRRPTNTAARSASIDRRVASAKAERAAARQRVEAAEAELRAAGHRRQGFQTWARVEEDRLAVAQIELDEAAAAVRAQEAKLEDLRREHAVAREAVEHAGSEAMTARRRSQAVNQSIRLARSARRSRRLEGAVRLEGEALEAARRAERAAAEELASRQAFLDRALEKVSQAAKEEAATRERRTETRRAAARASITWAEVMREAREASTAERGAAEEGAAAPDAERLEQRLAAAWAKVLAAAEEARRAAEVVESARSEAKDALARLVEAREAAGAAAELVQELEEERAEIEQGGRDAEPSLVEVQADAHAAHGPLGTTGRSVRVARQVWKIRRLHRRSRKNASELEVARRELEAAHARLDEATATSLEARDRIEEGRGVEAEARKSLIEARRRHGNLAGVLTRMRSADGAGMGQVGGTFQLLLIVRDHGWLGSLSVEQWADRAFGHAQAPRFILERNGEALWLYRGEWVVADPNLTLDDLAVLDEALGAGEGQPVEAAREKAPSGRRGRQPEPEVVQFVWERDGGSCAECGSVANLEIDHVIPVYFGGGDGPSNLQLLCRNCRRAKSHQL